MARRDDVLVVDWMGYRDGCGSGVSSLIPAIRQGLAGVVIDGCWRDVAELRQLDFPVFGRGISPYSPPKHEFGEINVPVCCGGVIVEPGDVIVADSEGVAVVPRRHATDVARSLPGTRHEIRKSVNEYPEVSPSLQRRAAAYLRSLELVSGASRTPCRRESPRAAAGLRLAGVAGALWPGWAGSRGFPPRGAGRGGMMRVVRPLADVVPVWRARPRELV
jgi:hypothetical protein